MKHAKTAAIAAVTLALALAGCSASVGEPTSEALDVNAVEIVLSDDGVSVDGAPVGNDADHAVYAANDIIYYEAGKGIAYGEGSDADAHDAAVADAHTVVHIAKPGTYRVSGALSHGQIAVDLGEGAKEDPNAVVTLILNGADVTCEVAPAVIFYNAYECGNDDAESASETVDTSAAGANVVIADGTVNNVNGSYVARIYQPDSVVLSEDETEVEDAEKLHKYDAALYSKVSMNVGGGAEGTGVLNIRAENEGLGTEMHLTINGGSINIRSGNDGINTNEDGVSVTTVNGGALNIAVTGETGEGDGIDSNGWLVINGGHVAAAACSESADAGIDSDMGIHIKGGTVVASGRMLDRIQDGGQTYAVFSFQEAQNGSDTLRLKDEGGKTVMEVLPGNDYTTLVLSSPELTAGTYTLWTNEQQLVAQVGGMAGMPGASGAMSDDEPAGPGAAPGDAPAAPGDPQKGMVPPQENMPPSEGVAPNDVPALNGEEPMGNPPESLDDTPLPPSGQGAGSTQEFTSEFKVSDGANMFSVIRLG